MTKTNADSHRTVEIAGTIVCGVGILIALAGWIFNLATASNDGGANIGAGLLVLAGGLIAVCGVVIFLVALIIVRAKRNR